MVMEEPPQIGSLLSSDSVETVPYTYVPDVQYCTCHYLYPLVDTGAGLVCENCGNPDCY